MSKEDDIKFLKIQTCVLKVNIHCEGCKKKVKKVLQKVHGVFQTTIDAEQGIVTVSGDVDPETVVKKLNKAGKHAELLHHKGVNNQLQKSQPEKFKVQQNKDNGKPTKNAAGVGAGSGGKTQKGQPAAPPQLQQPKMFDLKLSHLKDLKFPFQKDPKSVKFSLPPEADENGSDYDDFDDDDDDYDDDDVDEFDSFDADFDGDFQKIKLKPGSAPPNAVNAQPAAPDKKNGKKGGGVEIPVQVKGMNESNDGKKGAGNQGQGGGGKSAGKSGNGGGGAQDAKNVGNNANPKSNANAGKKNNGSGGKNEPASAVSVGAQFRPPASFSPGINPGQMGLAPPTGHTAGAVQGLPAGMAPPGHFPGAGMPALSPEMMSAAAAAGGGVPNNAYQQQYMAALMQQQQQQQKMMMSGQDRGYPPMMGYPRPPPPAIYMPQPQMQAYGGEPYTNYFSDENANSCSVM